ncbi:LysR family transcriptional regulator [Salana multivorans]
MDVQVLRWFQQVADGVTVTEVAEAELVSQPAVSRALARLEKEVGAPLLRREGRILRMTTAGAAFKGHVDAAIHHVDDGLAAVHQVLDPETGIVTVAYQPSLGPWLVPDLVSSFRAEHPGVEFDLRAKFHSPTPATGPGSDIDVELSAFRNLDPGWEWRRIASEPTRLLVPPDHQLASATEPVRLAQVAGERFVVLREATMFQRHVDEMCRDAGFVPEVAFAVDDLETIRGYVAAGLGVALAPATWGGASAEPSPLGPPAPVVLALADAGASREVGVTWWRDARILPSARLFIRHVLSRARAGELPAPTPV